MNKTWVKHEYLAWWKPRRRSFLGKRGGRGDLALTLAVLLAGLLGCTPTRVEHPVKPAIPEDWRHAPASAAPVDLRAWWRGFDDPLLNELIDRALTANHDLKIAKARVREARAMVTVADSARYPSLDVSASGGREKRIDRIVGVPGSQGIELIAPTADAFTGGLTARWEIDLFGARQLEAEAAAAQGQGAEAARQAVQVGVLAQVATNYLELRGVRERADILRENIKLQRERLRTTRALYGAGLASEADVSSQETLLHGTEGALPALTVAEAALMHRLGVLLGEAPGQLESRLAAVAARPAILPGIPKRLPASLLSQRPDVRLAETEVTAAVARLGAARADLFPKLVLSASAGFGALAAGGFPSLAEGVYTLGSGLTAPIFNAGRIRARIAAADARLDQAAANYEKTFLLALEDVENAFVVHGSSLARSEDWTLAETAAAQAYWQVDALYRQGAADYPRVLEAQRHRLSASDERAKAATDTRVSLVSLYRALGGGWRAEP